MPNTQPLMTARGLSLGCQITAANTNVDGTGALGVVVTGDRYGTRVDMILAKALASTTVGLIRLFMKSGSTYRLIGEITVAAVTASGTVPTWEGSWIPTLPVILRENETIEAATYNGDDFNLVPFGGDF